MIEVREVVKRECKENPEYLDLLADPEKDFDYKGGDEECDVNL